MERHVLSVLVANQAGVLARVVALFSRRGYNIDGLTVAETENHKISRITIAITEDKRSAEQIKKQLDKLVDVIAVSEMEDSECVFRELALVKIAITEESRSNLMEIIDIFRAKIVSIGQSFMVAEITGNANKVDAFVSNIGAERIVEMVCTGLTALQRGESGLIKSNEKGEEEWQSYFMRKTVI